MSFPGEGSPRPCSLPRVAGSACPGQGIPPVPGGTGLLCLGIDPGIGICGWALVRQRGDRLVAEGYGAIRTAPSDPLPVRLLDLHRALEAVLGDRKPHCAAVERLYFGRNVTTAEMVFQARGVTLLFAARLGIPVFEPKPAEVKQTVCGYGSADKAQVRGMVRLILGLDELPSPDDAADALAIAVVGLALASAPGAAFSPEVCR